jgi:methylglyoxal synthase
MKTLIGVLASHDSPADPDLNQLLKEFRFVVTGGTYARLFKGVKGARARGATSRRVKPLLSKAIAKFLHEGCGVIRLPPTDEGGVVMLSHLITQRKLSILWPFMSPSTAHLLFPENLALLRLADQWRVKKLMNKGSVLEWLRIEANRDAKLNMQRVPFDIAFAGSGVNVRYNEAILAKKRHSVVWAEAPSPDFLEARKRNQINPELMDAELENAVVALISHDEMKNRMLDFVIDYEHELAKFKSIVATGTTGKLIQEASPVLANKVKSYHSGPKGGDIEIATEILCGGCHVVIFLVDPLHPHPHIEDIRVVFGACMINDQVRMLSNEIQARDWMDTVVRGR